MDYLCVVQCCFRQYIISFTPHLFDLQVTENRFKMG